MGEYLVQISFISNHKKKNKLEAIMQLLIKYTWNLKFVACHIRS